MDAHAACGMMSYCVPYTYHPLNDSFMFSEDAHMQRCPLYTNFDDIPTIFGKVSVPNFMLLQFLKKSRTMLMLPSVILLEF